MGVVESENRNQQGNYSTKSKILAKLGHDASASDVLDYLIDRKIGGREICGSDDYYLFKYSENEMTILNRLNLMYVVPILFIFSPIQWLFTGETGVSRNSKIGKIVHKLVNFDAMF